jgi:hypothetical protein
MKLAAIIASFTVFELNRFRKYVASPFFNEKEAVLRLLDALLPYFKQKNTPILWDDAAVKQKLWAAAHGQTDVNEPAYNDTQFRRLCSDLNKLAEGFLAQTALENNVFAAQNYALRGAYSRNLPKHFRAIAAAQREQAAQARVRDADFYLQQYIFENTADAWLVRDMRRTAQTNVEAATRQLDLFYLAKRLRAYCDMLNYQTVLKLNLETAGLAEIQKLVQQLNYATEPLIHIYSLTLLTLTDFENTAHYSDLLAALAQHSGIITAAERREIYTFAMNYCIRKINLGDTDFYQKLFDLYQYVLQYGYILDNDELPPWDYKNIITLGLRLQAYAWTEDFIAQYNDRLPLNFRANAKVYNLAKLAFAKQNFTKVITLLQNVIYQDVFYNLDSKALLIKTYYELDELEAIDALLESFRIYLVREKTVSETTRQQFLNFIRFTRKLCAAPTKKQAATIRQQLDATPDVADKRWLLAKFGG